MIYVSQFPILVFQFSNFQNERFNSQNLSTDRQTQNFPTILLMSKVSI